MTLTRLWLPAVVYAGILVVSGRSSDELPDLPAWTSYAGHFGEYAMLAASLRWAVDGVRRPAAVVLGAVAVLAAIDETFQSTVPGRDPSVLDGTVDLLAAAIVVGAWRRMRGAVTRRRGRDPADADGTSRTARR